MEFEHSPRVQELLLAALPAEARLACALSWLSMVAMFLLRLGSVVTRRLPAGRQGNGPTIAVTARRRNGYEIVVPRRRPRQLGRRG
jgi:hypothetical protein